MLGLPLGPFSQSGTFSDMRCIEKVPKGDAWLMGLLPQCGSWRSAVTCTHCSLTLISTSSLKISRKRPPCTLLHPLKEWPEIEGHATPDREDWTRWGGCSPRMPQQRPEAQPSNSQKLTGSGWSMLEKGMGQGQTSEIRLSMGQRRWRPFMCCWLHGWG